MKKGVLSLIAWMLIVSAWGQLTEIRDVGAFSAVRVSEGINAYLRKGKKEEIKIEAQGIPIDHILTEVSKGTLKVHLREGYYRSKTVRVYITYVVVTELNASSAGSIFHEGICKMEKLELGASSAGSIEIKVASDELEASASSAGEIELEGTAARANFSASSAGEINAYDLQTAIVHAQASSGGDVKLSVTKVLDARASSGGSIRYKGNPERSNTNASSGGSVRKSD